MRPRIRTIGIRLVLAALLPAAAALVVFAGRASADTTPLHLKATIDVPGAYDVGFDPGTNLAYVSSSDGNTAVDMNTDTVTGTVSAPNSTVVGVYPPAHTVFVGDDSGAVDMFTAGDASAQEVYRNTYSPDAIATDPASHHTYVAYSEGGPMSVFDAGTGQHLFDVPVAGRDMAFDESGRMLFLGDDVGQLRVVGVDSILDGPDGVTDDEVDIPLDDADPNFSGAYVLSMAYDSTTQKLFVIEWVTDTDYSQHVILHEIQVPAAFTGQVSAFGTPVSKELDTVTSSPVLAAAGGTLIMVDGQGLSTLEQMDETTLTEVAQTTADAGINHIRFAPNGELWVPNGDDGTVSVYTLTTAAPPPPTSTATTLTVDNTTPVEATPVHLTAAVAPTPDGGTISFSANSVPISGCTAVAVNDGTASCTASWTHALGYALTAAYSGDPTFPASTSNTVNINVVAGPVATLAIQPANASITLGGTQTYTATGTDAAGNPLGDITASTTFNITPDGSCAGATCTPAAAGPHTVSATDRTATTSAPLTVTPPGSADLAIAATQQLWYLNSAPFLSAFTITVTNHGPDPALNVVTEMIRVSSTSGTLLDLGGGTINSQGRVIYHTPILANGASVTFHLTFLGSPVPLVMHTSSATPDPKPLLNNNTVPVLLIPTASTPGTADLSLGFTNSCPDCATRTLTVTNHGPNPATNVRLFFFKGAAPASINGLIRYSAVGVIELPLAGPLAPGSSTTIQVQRTTGGQIVAVSDSPELTPLDNTIRM